MVGVLMRRKGHMLMEAEIGVITAASPGAPRIVGNCQKLERGKEGFSPGIFRERERLCWHLDFELLVSRFWENKLCCFKPPSFGILLWQSSKINTGSPRPPNILNSTFFRNRKKLFHSFRFLLFLSQTVQPHCPVLYFIYLPD